MHIDNPQHRDQTSRTAPFIAVYTKTGPDQCNPIFNKFKLHKVLNRNFPTST